jgi:hypothetical protein
LTLPLALLACEGVASLAGYVSSRIGRWRGATNAGVALALAGVVVAPSVRDLPAFFSLTPPTSIEALRWLATQPSPDGREGVLASWELGHLVLYHAGKPVVASPFGTEGGPGALQDTARFQFSDDASEAEGILLRRRIGFVVSGWPMLQAYMDGQLASPGNDLVRQTCDYGRGLVIDYAPAYLDRTGPRLFFLDGLPRPDGPGPSFGGLRLLYETTPGRKEQIKIFGVVAGARIRVVGAAPGEPVRGEVQLQTNQRRQLTWRTEAEAGLDGSAELRLPYATGMNGTVVAGAWRIVGGAREVVLPVAEDDVVLGRTVEVHLAAGPG